MTQYFISGSLVCSLNEDSTEKGNSLLTHSHTMTPFDACGKQAF